jgi:organic radical activating enzyme
MRGRNPVRKQELGDGQSLWIQEVFYTLQGEGPFTGHPSVFVRTAGCNLRCFWCDTEFESSTWRPTLAQLLERIEARRPAHCDLVVLTGGEPLRQNVGPLVRTLMSRGLRVQIETSGSLWVDLPSDPRLTIVCSPKTPRLDRRLAARADAFKYVITAGGSDPKDGLPNVSTQARGRSARLYRPPPGRPIYVSPCDEPGKLDANIRAATQIALEHGYRLTLQTHKLVGIP